MHAFDGCDLIIEAAVENLDLKRKIFAELDAVAPPHAILASNTSSLAITDMAAATRRPDKVLGLHFMQPVPVMTLLEMVRTFLTSEETFQTAKSFGESLGKTIIVSQDTPGFIVNRLLIPYLLQAIEALERGVATKEDFDTGIRLGLGHPMGPFTLLDFVGLDTTLFVADAVFDGDQGSAFRRAAPAAPDGQRGVSGQEEREGVLRLRQVISVCGVPGSNPRIDQWSRLCGERTSWAS